MVTSTYEWKILELDVKPQTKKKIKKNQKTNQRPPPQKKNQGVLPRDPIQYHSVTLSPGIDWSFCVSRRNGGSPVIRWGSSSWLLWHGATGEMLKNNHPYGSLQNGNKWNNLLIWFKYHELVLHVILPCRAEIQRRGFQKCRDHEALVNAKINSWLVRSIFYSHVLFLNRIFKQSAGMPLKIS